MDGYWPHCWKEGVLRDLFPLVRAYARHPFRLRVEEEKETIAGCPNPAVWLILEHASATPSVDIVIWRNLFYLDAPTNDEKVRARSYHVTGQSAGHGDEYARVLLVVHRHSVTGKSAHDVKLPTWTYRFDTSTLRLSPMHHAYTISPTLADTETVCHPTFLKTLQYKHHPLVQTLVTFGERSMREHTSALCYGKLWVSLDLSDRDIDTWHVRIVRLDNPCPLFCFKLLIPSQCRGIRSKIACLSLTGIDPVVHTASGDVLPRLVVWLDITDFSIQESNAMIIYDLPKDVFDVVHQRPVVFPSYFDPPTIRDFPPASVILLPAFYAPTKLIIGDGLPAYSGFRIAVVCTNDSDVKRILAHTSHTGTLEMNQLTHGNHPRESECIPGQCGQQPLVIVTRRASFCPHRPSVIGGPSEWKVFETSVRDLYTDDVIAMCNFSRPSFLWVML